MKTLHIDQLKAFQPCSSDKIDKFGKRKRLNIHEAFERGYTVSDICWLLGKLKRLNDHKTFVKFCGEKWPYPRVLRANPTAAYIAEFAYIAADDEAANAAEAAALAVAYNSTYDAVRDAQITFLKELLS